MTNVKEVEITQDELDDLLEESLAIRDEIAIEYGTGVAPVLEEIARRYPSKMIWEMTRNQLKRRPPARSARGYIPKVVETAARELGFVPVRVAEPAKGR